MSYIPAFRECDPPLPTPRLPPIIYYQYTMISSRVIKKRCVRNRFHGWGFSCFLFFPCVPTCMHTFTMCVFRKELLMATPAVRMFDTKDFVPFFVLRDEYDDKNTKLQFVS